MNAPFSTFLFSSAVLFLLSFRLSGQVNNSSINSFKEREALLILPGFGSKVFGTKKLKSYFKERGYDLFIPKYISRKSLDVSVENLNNFMLKQNLKDYKKVHVFAYIFGTWTINNWIKKYGKGNICTIVYDRSPLQERAPLALVKDSPLMAKLLFGNVMKDFSNLPYPVIEDSSIFKGIFIENYATKLINKHRKTVMSFGNVSFDINHLNQSVVDFCYIPLNHDEMYNHPEVFGPEILYFIQNQSFSQEIKAKKYQVDPFIKFRKN